MQTPVTIVLEVLWQAGYIGAIGIVSPIFTMHECSSQRECCQAFFQSVLMSMSVMVNRWLSGNKLSQIP